MQPKISARKEPGQGLLGRVRFGLWDILTGLPAGALIFMGTVLLSTLSDTSLGHLSYVPVLFLGIISLMVGILAGITRLSHGPATALCAGFICAGILLYLSASAQPEDIFNHYVFGPIGMFTTILISTFGGWIGARSRR